MGRNRVRLPRLKRDKGPATLVVTSDPDHVPCPKCGAIEEVKRYCWGAMIHYCEKCGHQFDVRKPEHA